MTRLKQSRGLAEAVDVPDASPDLPRRIEQMTPRERIRVLLFLEEAAAATGNATLERLVEFWRNVMRAEE